MAAGTEAQGRMAAALGRGAKITAQLRAGQAADPKLLDASTADMDWIAKQEDSKAVNN